MPANFARFCRRRGADVKLVSCVGNDGIGRKIIKELAEQQVEISDIESLDDEATSMIMVSKSKATPEFISYRAADRFIRKITQEEIESCSIFHSTAFALSAEPAQSNLLAAISYVQKAGKKLSIDWNYSDRIWGQENNAREIFSRVMQENTLLKISMDDAVRFWNISGEVDTIKSILDEYPAAVICFSNGAEGVHYRTNEAGWTFIAALPANVVDTTGAGDAFWSSFITAYHNEEPVAKCVETALEVAREKVEGKF